MDGTMAEKKIKEQANSDMRVLDSSWHMVVSSFERSCEIMEELFLTARAEANR